MAKLTLNDLANLQNESTAIASLSDNNALTETAMENTLSRDGTAPNEMHASLDMNSHRILNLPDPSNDSEPVTLGMFVDSSAGPITIVQGMDGPASSVDTQVAVFNGTTGKLLKTSTAKVDSSGNLTAKVAATGGSISREIVDHVANWTYAKNFNVKADGSTNDTAALQAAINATPDGGTLVLPYGLCKVIGSGSTCLTIAKSINIIGQGWGSGLIADSTVPNTRDILSVIVSTSTRGFVFRDFRITNVSSARHALKVDGNGATNLVYGIHCSRLQIDVTLGGNSINGSGSATAGVFAYSSIKDCLIESIKIDTCGDGLEIQGNTIGGLGANTAINITQVIGAGGLSIKNNVLTGTAGHIVIDRGYPVIEGNELEQFANNTQANGAMIDLNGGTGTGVAAAKVENNTLSVNSGITGVTNALRLGTTVDTHIAANRFSIRGSNSHIAISNASSNIYIEESNSYYKDDLRVALILTDSGTRTGITSSEHFLTLSASQTGSNSSTPQVWFPGGGATLINVEANNAYFFEGVLSASKTAGTTPRVVSLLFAGSATTSSIGYTFVASTADIAAFPLLTATALGGWSDVATANQVLTSSSSANQCWMVYVKGIVRFTGAGSFIPQFKYDAAPGGAPTVRPNTFFRMNLIGPDTVLTRGWA